MNTSQSVSCDKKRKYLIRYRINKRLLDRLVEKYDNLCDSLEVKSPKISDLPRGSGGLTMNDKIIEKIELEERINKLIQRGDVYRREICEAIDSLEDVRQADVLERYLIDCQSYYDIACELGYTERHVKRLFDIGVSLCCVDVMEMS